MNTLFRSWCLLGLGLAFALNVQGADRELTIQVLVYNYAGVSPGTLSHAKQEAGRIYRQIGVGVEWRDCPVPPEEGQPEPLCGLPSAPTKLTFRLLSDSMARRLTPRDDVLGWAFLWADGGFGLTANVFVGRAWQRADVCPLSRSLVLGLLMAHELGHLLLGRPEHAVSGAMSVPLMKGCPESLSRGRKRLPPDVFFLSHQAARIRDNIVARIASQRAANAVPAHLQLQVGKQ
jgi:hypothetical protein